MTYSILCPSGREKGFLWSQRCCCLRQQPIVATSGRKSPFLTSGKWLHSMWMIPNFESSHINTLGCHPSSYAGESSSRYNRFLHNTKKYYTYWCISTFNCILVEYYYHKLLPLTTKLISSSYLSYRHRNWAQMNETLVILTIS